MSREPGGFSGPPLHATVPLTLMKLRSWLGLHFPLIGIGGINSIETAVALRRAGTDLVQLNAGLIYQRPGLVKAIANGLADSEVMTVSGQY
jgi:dihydroorotate dehydrogenase